MTEKRFEYIRTKYRHYIQDVEKDGEYREGYRGTYDDFDLDKITDLLNKFNNENEQLKQSLDYYKKIETSSERTELKRNNLILKTSLKEARKENEQLKKQIKDMQIRFKRKYDCEFDDIVDELD